MYILQSNKLLYNSHPFPVGFSVVGETTSVGQSLRHLQ